MHVVDYEWLHTCTMTQHKEELDFWYKEKMEAELEALLAKLEAAQTALVRTQARIDLQRRRMREALLIWKQRQAHIEAQLRQRRLEGERELQAASTQLLFSERQLQKDKEDGETVIREKDQIIEEQKQRISDLEGLHKKLTQALREQKARNRGKSDTDLVVQSKSLAPSHQLRSPKIGIARRFFRSTEALSKPASCQTHRRISSSSQNDTYDAMTTYRYALPDQLEWQTKSNVCKPTLDISMHRKINGDLQDTNHTTAPAQTPSDAISSPFADSNKPCSNTAGRSFPKDSLVENDVNISKAARDNEDNDNKTHKWERLEFDEPSTVGVTTSDTCEPNTDPVITAKKPSRADEVMGTREEIRRLRPRYSYIAAIYSSEDDDPNLMRL